MTVMHTIHCAGNLCGEYSVRADFQAKDREEAARNHRQDLIGEGWADIEGRDYCPEHKEG